MKLGERYKGGNGRFHILISLSAVLAYHLIAKKKRWWYAIFEGYKENFHFN